jgi:predicted nucleotidyltransferase component of viral defense system
MILRKEIAEKSVLWGIPPDNVDKDWVLGHLISAFYEVPPHIEKIIFKGGTCLRKCRFPDYRFSEDLDFTSKDPDYQLTREVINNILEIVHQRSSILMHLAELNDLRYRDMLAGYQAKIRYWGANHGKNQVPPAPERWLTSIKLEITLFEQMEFEPDNLLINHPYSDFNSLVLVEVPCYKIKEMIAEKIRSLVQRSYTAPRDFYDIWILNKYLGDGEWVDVRNAFNNKMRYKGYTFTGINQLINEKSLDILKRSWQQSLGHQLHSSSLPDIDTVIKELTDAFEKHLHT